MHNTSVSLMCDTDYRNRFRWAVCQLDALGKCRNRLMLRHALTTLPPTLDATYDRILCAINEEDSEYAVRILRWLAFSSRPLLLEEISEVVAINTDRDPMFNQDEVLEDPLEILDMCSSLITITTTDNIIEDFPQASKFGYVPSGKVVGLAHYSVKEYLISKRSRPNRAEKYSIQDASCNGFLAISCLGYLLQFDKRDLFSSKDVEASKLAQYAAEFWFTHALAAGESGGRLNHQIMSFFSKKNAAYFNWAKMFNPESSMDRPNFTRTLENVPTPLYFASLFGWTDIVEQLLAAGADINAQGGYLSYALHAASDKGHEKTVELLITAGANINAQGGYYYKYALHVASQRGHEKIVERLLSAGADINAEGGRYGNALQAASAGGHNKTIETLLTACANINAEGGLYGDALQEASVNGHDKIIETLLTAGANINTQGGLFGNALQAASSGGHNKAIETLLAAGANVNARGGLFITALQAASLNGHNKTVEALLTVGADINAQGGYYGSALQAASQGGYNKTVEAGADVNALQAASQGDYKKIVEVLLSNGADVNAQGGCYDNALQAASERGCSEIVELLLAAGANVNAQGRRYGNALQAALANGHNEAVELLLGKGARRDL